MPEFYRKGEYDVAGFVVGVVSKNGVLDGSNIAEGDVVIGFPSVGLHTNGYSLARKVFFEIAGWKAGREVEEFGRTVGEELLVPHRCYISEIRRLKSSGVKGIAHITGGGIPGNLSRIIPRGLCARVEVGGHDIPVVFGMLQRLGDIATDEMYRVFNMGVGLIAVMSPEDAERFTREGAADAKPCVLGRVVRGDEPVEMVYLS
jgi:phosphoribosylformylglycinamidine cyclo-ligase